MTEQKKDRPLVGVSVLVRDGDRLFLPLEHLLAGETFPKEH